MNDVVAVPERRDEIAQLNSGISTMFHTFNTDNFEDKMRLVNAIADSEPIADHINEWLCVKDFVVQNVDINETNEDTGEEVVSTAIQVVLITDSGKAYRVMSSGVFRDLKAVLNILGYPKDWERGVEMKVIQGQSGKNRYYSLRCRLVSDGI